MKKVNIPRTKSWIQLIYFILVPILLILVSPQISNEAVYKVKTMHDYIEQYLKLFPNLEYAEVLAVINRESGGKADLVTYEKSVKDYSYGPMQVRGKTLRAMGFRGDFRRILNYEDGIYWGMKFLSICKENVTREYLKTHKVKNKNAIRKRTFATYNAGGVYWRTGYEGEKYINHSYVRACEWHYWKLYKYNKFFSPENDI